MILNPSVINHINAKPAANKIIRNPCIKKSHTNIINHRHPNCLGNDLECKPMILYESKYINAAKIQIQPNGMGP